MAKQTNKIKRNEKGQFIKGCGFWTGKKRPNLMNTNAVKTMFKKGLVPWNDGVKGYTLDKKANDKAYNWKGNNVGYFALHKWINRKMNKPKCCEMCGEEKTLEAHNISGTYKRYFDDWEFLCRRCHMIKDGRLKGVMSL